LAPEAGQGICGSLAQSFVSRAQMCFGHEDKRLNYLKSWAVFFMISSLLTIYTRPNPMIQGSGGINWASVFGLVIGMAPFIATQKMHFQIMCCLYGTSGAIKIVMGIVLGAAIFAVAGTLASMDVHNEHENAKEQQEREQAQHGAGFMIIAIGMIPVILIMLSATCSCCAGHYAHQVANYLEKGTIDDLKNNKAVEARETVGEPESEQNSDYLRIV